MSRWIGLLVVVTACKGGADSAPDTDAATHGDTDVTACASLADFADPSGTRLVLSDAAFAADAANLGGCGSASDAWALTFTFTTTDGGGYEPFFELDSAAVADDGTPSHDGSFTAAGACAVAPIGVDDNGFECDGIQDCHITCPLCYTTPPTDLAVQFETRSAERSQAVCVLPSSPR
jgi:hypothetical protein